MPKIQSLVDALESGAVKWEDIPNIKVTDGMIVEGNHRYIASRILKLEARFDPGSFGTRIRPVVPWETIPISPKKW